MELFWLLDAAKSRGKADSKAKSFVMFGLLQNMRKNSIVSPRDIADDPVSLVFEAVETIMWKLPVAQIVLKFF